DDLRRSRRNAKQWFLASHCGAAAPFTLVSISMIGVRAITVGEWCRRHAGLSARNFRWPARAIDAADGLAVRCGVPRHIKIDGFGGIGKKLRLWQEGEPCHRVERRLCFVPLDTCVFDPEVRVPTLTPVGHPVGVEELHSEIKG